MDGDDFFPAGTPLLHASPPFSEHDWGNGGSVILPFFKNRPIEITNNEIKIKKHFTQLKQDLFNLFYPVL